MIKAQRAQYNEFVESGLENQTLTSQVTIIGDSNDDKVKIDQFYLKKIVLSTIRGNQFLYISLEFDYKFSSQCYSVLLLILRPPFLGYSLYFISPSSLHLYPPCVDQIPDVDPCPINTFLKSLESSCKAENYCLGITFSLMQLKSQLQTRLTQQNLGLKAKILYGAFLYVNINYIKLYNTN